MKTTDQLNEIAESILSNVINGNHSTVTSQFTAPRTKAECSALALLFAYKWKSYSQNPARLHICAERILTAAQAAEDRKAYARKYPNQIVNEQD